MNQVDRVRDCLDSLNSARYARAQLSKKHTEANNVQKEWLGKVKPDGSYYDASEIKQEPEYVLAVKAIHDLTASLITSNAVFESCELDYSLELEILRSQRSLPTVAPRASVRRNRLSRLGRRGLK